MSSHDNLPESPDPTPTAVKPKRDAASSIVPPALTVSPAPRLGLSDSFEKIMYFFALIVGSSAIFVGKIAGWLAAWPGALFAVGCIVVYFVLAWIANRENKIRADRLGDNCYYLGLVYTLSSLIATLYLIDKGADVRTLLGNFGLALMSTAAGIIARLIMIQMRSETDDIDQRARVMLAETANHMKTDLLGAASAFRTLLVGAQETLDVSVKKTEASFAAAKALSDKMAALEVSPEALNDALRRVVGHLEAAGDRIAAAGGELRDQSATVSTTASAVERADAGLRRVDEVLTELTQSLVQQRLATEETVKALREHQDYLRRYRESMEQDAEKARQAVEKVYSALGDLAHTIVKRVQP